MIDFNPAMPEYKCGHCGLVHYAVTAKQAIARVRELRAELTLGSAASRATLMDYFLCARCQMPTSQFCIAEPDDAPEGATLPACIVSAALWRQSESLRNFDEEAQVNV